MFKICWLSKYSKNKQLKEREFLSEFEARQYLDIFVKCCGLEAFIIAPFIVGPPFAESSNVIWFKEL